MKVKNELKDIIFSIKRHIELEGLAGTGAVGNGDSAIFSKKNRALSPFPVRAPVPNKTTDAWVGLKHEVGSCAKCELSKTRTRVVFGSGSPKARLMFVGEAPGRDEDLQGLPFVGRAGQLLTKIIESIGLKREDVYIANILKCRPPNNRNPYPTEILACEGYLLRQIELIKPKLICTLGKFAAQALLRSTEPISRLRGRFFDYHGSRLIPTYHPAYLLRNPSDKYLVWEDMKKIRKIINGK
ncbi:MAG: uracil-DNA glycosylase [Omnitrophica bacterium]|nr:uracil-DNA glycosylase [Candidatus Omnitrophota bacterium]